MGLIVQKFGESSLNGTDSFQIAAERIAKAYKNGDSVVAVAPAQPEAMGKLVRKARNINPGPSKREMDMLLSAGGQAQASLLAMAVEAKGCPVVSLTGFQGGITSDSNYGNARIKSIDTERIFRELDRKNVVVIAGGQAWNKFDDITTFGEGGSNTTAVAVAAALKADLCEIYTESGGVYTADPAVVKNAARLGDISYDELLELSSLGANILHSRSVELAKKYNVVLVIKSILDNTPGTVVKEVGSVEKMLVRGVARDSNIARIAVIGVQDKPGVAFKLFSILAKENIGVDLIIQSIGRDDIKDISFTIAKQNLDRALEVLNAGIGILGAKEIQYSDRYSKLSIVGAGIVNNPAVAAMMFEALYNANINIHMISTSEIKISVLVDAQDADMGVNAIHEKFMLGELGK